MTRYCQKCKEYTRHNEKMQCSQCQERRKHEFEEFWNDRYPLKKEAKYIWQ